MSELARIEAEETAQSEVVVRPNTADEEYDRVVSYLERMPWYRQHGYKIALPKHPVFQALAAEGADLSPLKLPETRQLFKSEEYDGKVYENLAEELRKAQPMFGAALSKFREFNTKWGFKIYPRYEVRLTVFGTGGSYFVDSGKVVISPRSMLPPGPTWVHEAVHLGIAEGIVDRFKLTHGEKERTVDGICLFGLGDLLPGYKYQRVGDNRIDAYVTSETVNNLPAAIERYVKDHPREN